MSQLSQTEKCIDKNMIKLSRIQWPTMPRPCFPDEQSQHYVGTDSKCKNNDHLYVRDFVGQ